MRLFGDFAGFQNEFVAAERKFNTTCLHEIYLSYNRQQVDFQLGKGPW